MSETLQPKRLDGSPMVDEILCPKCNKIRHVPVDTLVTSKQPDGTVRQEVHVHCPTCKWATTYVDYISM